MRLNILKKGKYYEIYAENKLIGLFTKKTINSLKIDPKKDYSKEYIKKIKIFYTLICAQKKAISLLKIKDYSKQELFLKLKKNYPEKIAKLACLKMQKLGFVNDFKYAKNLALNLIFKKNKSKKLAIFEITKKGIEKNLAEKILNSIEFNPVDIIEKLIVKKHLNKLKDLNSKKKLISSLLRLGHNYYNITAAIEKITQNSKTF